MRKLAVEMHSPFYMNSQLRSGSRRRGVGTLVVRVRNYPLIVVWQELAVPHHRCWDCLPGAQLTYRQQPESSPVYILLTGTLRRVGHAGRSVNKPGESQRGTSTHAGRLPPTNGQWDLHRSRLRPRHNDRTTLRMTR